MIPSEAQLVLGTATLGLHGSRDDAFRLLDVFVDLGGKIIDTAAVYNDWVPGETRRSEGIIGEWRRRSPQHAGMFISTKGAHPPLSDMGRSRLDGQSIVDDVDASLRRLGVDRIDLFYLHRDDPALPVEEPLGTLAQLVAHGKIAAVGLSNWTAGRIAVARRSGVVPIASNQVLGNVLSRHMRPPADPSIIRLDQASLLDAEASGSSLLLFSSQAGGYLSKMASADAGPAEYRDPTCAGPASRIAALATRQGIDPTALAVGFLMAFSKNIFPIIGSRSVAQLERSMAASRLRLAPSVITELAAISGFSDWR